MKNHNWKFKLLGGALLRCCASCEWIFKATDGSPACPKCGFGSYGARYVYGKKAYRYAKTQKPWKDKKIDRYSRELDNEIKEAMEDLR